MTKNNSSILSFKNRERDLEGVKRYHKNKVMFYRTDLRIHTKRVEALVSHLIPAITLLYPSFDVKKAKLIARYHDDPEMIPELGDVQLSLKLVMSKKQLSDLEEKELHAIEKISKMYPKKVRGYTYKDLLLHAVHKDCIEAQFVSFVDKVDGYCEALHETLAGNTVFTESVINYHLRTFNNLETNFSLISKIFDRNFTKKNNFFCFAVVDFTEYFNHGSILPVLHTSETITRKSSISQYELWKAITLKTFQNGMELLTKQIEFH